MMQKSLAKLLNISPAMVSRLARRGMPVDDLERAKRWRARHLDPARLKGTRIDTVSSAPRQNDAATLPPANAAAADVAESAAESESAKEAVLRAIEFGDYAEELLAAGRFVAVQEALRLVLRAVPLPYRAEVLLSFPVWHALTDHVAAHLTPPAENEPPPASEQLDEMGPFWYSVAAGEVRLAPMSGPQTTKEPHK